MHVYSVYSCLLYSLFKFSGFTLCCNAYFSAIFYLCYYWNAGIKKLFLFQHFFLLFLFLV